MLRRSIFLVILGISTGAFAINPLQSAVEGLNKIETKLSLPQDILAGPIVMIGTIASFYALFKAYQHLSLHFEDRKSTHNIINQAKETINRVELDHQNAFSAATGNDVAAIKAIIQIAPAYGEFWECYTYSYAELIAHELYLAKDATRSLERRAAMLIDADADFGAIQSLIAQGKALTDKMNKLKDFVEDLPEYYTEYNLVEMLKA